MTGNGFRSIELYRHVHEFRNNTNESKGRGARNLHVLAFLFRFFTYFEIIFMSKIQNILTQLFSFFLIHFYFHNALLAHESKVGRVTLSGFVKKQVNKDAWLLVKKYVSKVVWHFFRSAVTGKIGGSKSLLKYLRDNKIKIQYHYYF